jgi:threonine aldolase
VGVLAAAGLVSLGLIERLAEDHAHARLLHEALVGCPGVDLMPVRTNIVVAHLEAGRPQQVVERLARDGVLASALDARTFRVVTHHDVDAETCRRAAPLIRAALA